MITTELDFLKSHGCLEQLIERVRQSGKDGDRIDEVERELFAGLMQMGFHLLTAFVGQAGDGDVGETVSVSADVKTTPSVEGEFVQETRTWRRLEQLHTRSYQSIFGVLTIHRRVYGTREDQKIEVVPLDARLGLPLGEFSYVLEDWQQRMCLKESFLEATGNLGDLLGVAPSVRATEVMNRKMAEYAPGFRQEQPTPPAAEEGELVVFTADGKGIPMRRPRMDKQLHSPRRAKGEKANKKQMSYVGAVYTIDRFVRSPDDVLEELSRKEAKARRCSACVRCTSMATGQVLSTIESNKNRLKSTRTNPQSPRSGRRVTPVRERHRKYTERLNEIRLWTQPFQIPSWR